MIQIPGSWDARWFSPSAWLARPRVALESVIGMRRNQQLAGGSRRHGHARITRLGVRSNRMSRVVHRRQRRM